MLDGMFVLDSLRVEMEWATGRNSVRQQCALGIEDIQRRRIKRKELFLGVFTSELVHLSTRRSQAYAFEQGTLMYMIWAL